MRDALAEAADEACVKWSRRAGVCSLTSAFLALHGCAAASSRWWGKSIKWPNRWSWGRWERRKPALSRLSWPPLVGSSLWWRNLQNWRKAKNNYIYVYVLLNNKMDKNTRVTSSPSWSKSKTRDVLQLLICWKRRLSMLWCGISEI